MAAVKALVVTGYGTNCEIESAHAVRLVGAQADIVHFSELRTGKVGLTDYDLLVFPGGFLDGDDLGAAQAAALRWKFTRTAEDTSLLDSLKTFFDDDGLIIGICNGFQLLVKLGLLPAVGGGYFQRQVTLAANVSSRFEDRWVRLQINAHSSCVFTKGLSDMELPVRHGEGRLIPADDETLQALVEAGLVAMRYAHPDTGEPTEEYPYNPNGSPMGIAGLTDPSGRILGLMPHPEAYNHPTNHPAWTRGRGGVLGIELFRNAVAHISGR